MDLFKVGSNIQSMQALNNLYKLNEKMSVHQSRLSTGKRVNSAQDDTAGFSVAKNVETARQGYEQAQGLMDNHIAYLLCDYRYQCSYARNYPQCYPVEGPLCRICTLEISFVRISDISDHKAFDMPHSDHRRSVIKDHLRIIPICSNLIEQIRLSQIVLSTISI